MNRRRIAGIMGAGLLAACIFGACGRQTGENHNKAGEKIEADEKLQKVSRDIFAMDTVMTLTAYGKDADLALAEAEGEIKRLDELLSTGKPTSEIARLNGQGKGKVSEDSAYLIERSMEISRLTDGVFTIAIYPVMEAWGFPMKNYHVPEREELKKALSLTDVNHISFNKESKEISFNEKGVKIDLGGIAKGYTFAKIIDIYRKYGLTHGLVNLGGNVQTLGSKPDGDKWRVGIQDPEKTKEMIGVLKTEDQAVITSGGYERYFEEDGKTYHHIIDPKTGYPANNGLLSVTIVSPDGTLADGLSTSLFIMGPKKAIDFWKEHSNEFETIVMTDDRKLYVSEGLEDSFTSELPVQVVRKK